MVVVLGPGFSTRVPYESCVLRSAIPSPIICAGRRLISAILGSFDAKADLSYGSPYGKWILLDRDARRAIEERKREIQRLVRLAHRKVVIRSGADSFSVPIHFGQRLRPHADRTGYPGFPEPMRN